MGDFEAQDDDVSAANRLSSPNDLNQQRQQRRRCASAGSSAALPFKRRDSEPKSNESSALVKKEENKEKGNDVVLLVAFALFIVTSLGNRLFQKLMTIPMYNYPITVNLLSTSAYVPISFAYIVPAVYCMTTNSPITPEQTAIPKSRFAVMGALDCVSSLMQVLAVNFIPNASTLVLLQQSAIPISMVVSRLSFKDVRYDWWQISGAGVVLCGIAVVLAPQLLSPSSSNDDGPDAPGPVWLWPSMIILSCVPMCLGSVYKEKALGEHDVDVVYLNGWVAVFQTFMSLPLAIPTAFAINLPLADLPTNIIDGFKCYVGKSSYSNHASAASLVAAVDDDDQLGFLHNSTWFDNSDSAVGYRVDSCGSAPFFVTAFIAFNLAYNVLIIVILKRGSSSLLYLGSTVLVPVSNVMFSLNFIPGHKPLHLADVFGLAVIMCGLLLYRCGSAIFKFFFLTPGRFAALYSLLLLDDDEDDDDDEEDDESSKSPVRDYPEMPDGQSLLAVAQDREGDVPAQRRALEILRRRRPPRDRIARFFGLNQFEMLQPLAQAQSHQVRRRKRSNKKIREELMLKLGFRSPDALTAAALSPAQQQQGMFASPGDLRRFQTKERVRAQQRRDGRDVPSSTTVPTNLVLDKTRRSNSFDTRRRPM